MNGRQLIRTWVVPFSQLDSSGPVPAVDLADTIDDARDQVEQLLDAADLTELERERCTTSIALADGRRILRARLERAADTLDFTIVLVPEETP